MTDDTPVLWPDPIVRFADVFERAGNIETFDVTAMSLATSTADGRPSVRIVLLKEFDERGFVFYTNSESRKGRELLVNPHAAICIFYPTLGEQIRVEGAVEQVSSEESDDYFHSRPLMSQIGAWASEQSRPLDSRAKLIDRCDAIKERFKGEALPRPPHWYGFRLIPQSIEFWISGEFRLHDRFVYQRDNNSDDWLVTRLNP